MPFPKTIDDFARTFALVEAQGLEGYVDGGAGTEITLRRNREAWDAIELLPAVLRSAGTRDLTTTVLGTSEPAPLMIAPVGFQQYVHPTGAVEVAAAACRVPTNHRYTPAAGLPEMKDAIVAKTKRDSGYVIDASQVLVTNGGKQAVYQAFATIVDPGDEERQSHQD